MRLLVAEDDLTVRTMLVAVLEQAGYQLAVASDGLEALALLTAPDPPRLAILDWMMPGLDGVDVCRRVRQLETTDPQYLVLLTSRNDESSIIEGLDAGANDYLTKPFRTGELLARIGVGRRLLALQRKLHEVQAALAYEARHDALTGLLNRGAILEGLSRQLELAVRERAQLSVGLCDIDGFKQVNDTYGHLVGDEALKGVATLLRARLRDGDLLGRYGGEEFLVIAPGSAGLAAQQTFERLREAVAQNPITTSSQSLQLTISVGVAACPPLTTLEGILKAADDALYRAKDLGKNRTHHAPPSRPKG